MENLYYDEWITFVFDLIRIFIWSKALQTWRSICLLEMGRSLLLYEPSRILGKLSNTACCYWSSEAISSTPLEQKSCCPCSASLHINHFSSASSFLSFHQFCCFVASILQEFSPFKHIYSFLCVYTVLYQLCWLKSDFNGCNINLRFKYHRQRCTIWFFLFSLNWNCRMSELP